MDPQVKPAASQKESNELAIFEGRLINGIWKDLADGKFGNFGDHLPALLAAQPAFTGLSNFGKEQAEATVADKESRREILFNEMTDVEENDRYDIVHIIHGLECGYSLGKRTGYKEGQAEMLRTLQNKLNAQGTDINLHELV